MDTLAFAMYQASILDHNKHPHNKGVLSNPTFSNRHLNPSCGDKFTLYVTAEDGIVKDVRFDGVGCAISTASMSMLTDLIKGKPLDELKKLTENDIRSMLGIPISPGREQCAFLSLITLQEGLKHNDE